MTFKPTKARQLAWVKRHLNNGVCHKTKADHFELCPIGTACYEAMEWLADSDVTTLEEAWDQCPRPEWLLWTLRRMRPGRRDAKNLEFLVTELQQLGLGGDEFQHTLSRVKDRHTPLGKLIWVKSCFRLAYRGSRKQACALIHNIWGNPWRRK